MSFTTVYPVFIAAHDSLSNHMVIVQAELLSGAIMLTLASVLGFFTKTEGGHNDERHAKDGYGDALAKRRATSDPLENSNSLNGLVYNGYVRKKLPPGPIG